MWPWPLDFGQWSYMAGHVVNPSTKFEDPTAIHSWVMSSDISHRIPLTGVGRSLGGKISGGRGHPPTNILIPLERQLIALQLCRWLLFLYNETLQQTFRPLLSKSSKRRQIYAFWSPFEDVSGSVEPWLMARWKASVEFLLSVIGLLFLSLTVEALQGKMCQNSLPSGEGRSLGAKCQGEGVVPGQYFLVSTKLDTFCYPTVQTAPCYVP